MFGQTTTTDQSGHQTIYNLRTGQVQDSYDLDFYSLMHGGRQISADFDGDGAAEVLYTKDANSIMYSPFSGNHGSQYNNGFPQKYHNDNTYPGDFNGDGKLDLLTSGDGGNTWYINYYTGNGFDQNHFAEMDGRNKQTPLIGDFNGDGIFDIALSEVENGYYYFLIYYMYSNGHYTIRTYQVNSSQGTLVIDDFNNDGQMDIFDLHRSGQSLLHSFAYENNLYKLLEVSDGLNKKTTFTYGNSNEEPLYTQLSDQISYQDVKFPIVNMNTPQRVAINMTVSNPDQDITTIDQAYIGPMYHLQGNGFLGYKTVIRISNAQQPTLMRSETVSSIFNDEAFMSPHLNSVFNADHTLISKNVTTEDVISTLRSSSPAKVYTIKRLIAGSSATNYLTGSNSETNYTYDRSTDDQLQGNLLTVSNSVKHGSDVLSGSLTTYSNFVTGGGSKKFLPQNVTMTKTRSGQNAFSKDITMSYDPNTGQLISKTDFSGKDKAVITTYSYYPEGNGKDVTISANGINPRKTSCTFNDTKRFPATVTNPIGQSSSSVYNERLGRSTQMTDLNGITSTFEYDGWGRNIKTASNGVENSTFYEWTPDGQNTNLYLTRTKSSGSSNDVIHYMDNWGRDLQMRTTGYKGIDIFSLQDYNPFGEKTFQTNAFSDDDMIRTNYTYDENHRVKTMLTNELIDITNTYDGLNTTASTTDANTGSSIRTNAMTMDESGVSKTANDGIADLNYTYTSLDQVSSIITPNKTVSIAYDEYGRQQSLTDPDAGASTVTYDAFGQLTYQKDPNGNETYGITYDDLGRMTAKTLKAPGADALSYQFTFDADNGKGQLKNASVKGHSLNCTYDQRSRMIQQDEVIESAPNAFQRKYEYDDLNRLVKYTYPSGFAVKYVYDNQSGVCAEIHDASNDKLLWSLGAMNASGKVTSRTAGSGVTTTYTYDAYNFLNEVKSAKQGGNTVSNWTFDWGDKASGLLESRTNVRCGLTENFTYSHERLENVKDVAGNIKTGVSYDGNGASQITQKTDAGIYHYPIISNIVPQNSPDAIYSPTTAFSPSQQVPKYTAFNKVSQLTEGKYQLDIFYGCDEERTHSKLTNTTTGLVEEEKFFAGDYEYETKNGVTREIHYLTAADGLFAIVVKQGDKFTTYYTYQDYLGSIQEMTDENGKDVFEQSEVYPERSRRNAWGRRRNAIDWTYPAADAPYTGLFDRGYTAHQHLDRFGLINMNGRMYDPVLGMMISPDNFVQAPDHTGSFNRFSYCLNNPLRYSDPSGEVFGIDDAIIIGLAIFSAYEAGKAVNNGESNPTKWDWKSGSTYVGVIGGAAIGAETAGLGIALENVGAPLLFNLAFTSTFSSLGMNAVTRGRSDVSINYGFGSYDFDSGEFGYLGKKGNSGWENLAYGFGALGNLSDINGLINSTDAELYTDNSDFISHSALTEKDSKDLLISYGPDDNNVPSSKLGFAFKNRKGTFDYPLHDETPLTVDLSINKYTSNLVRFLGRNLPYQGATFNCVNASSLTLWLNGIPNIGIHPYLLYGSTYAYAAGFRPDLFSYNFTQKR